jgi:tetratricopeptide (TPR) repeat protein
MARRIARAGALLCLTIVSPVAGAAEGAGTEDPAQEAAYRKAIKDGVAEYDARHFEEARSLFRRAHELSPNARTYRGLGMTSFELRDYVLAVRNLSAALREERKPLSAEQRTTAQELLERSRMFVDVYKLKVTPPEARVQVDGRAPEFEPDGTLLLGFGAHTVEAKAQGMASRSLTINVRGGERKELALSLEPAPVARPTAPPPAPPTAKVAAQAPPPAEISNRAPLAWILAGAGAALLAGGAGVYWAMQNSELDSCRHPTAGLRCTDESAILRQRNIAIGATVGAGAAAVTMALIGVLTWRSKPPPAASPGTLACVPSPFGITCGGSF